MPEYHEDHWIRRSGILLEPAVKLYFYMKRCILCLSIIMYHICVMRKLLCMYYVRIVYIIYIVCNMSVFCV